MTVHNWGTTGGKDLIRDYIRKLSANERIAGFSVLEALEENRLDELEIKPWRGKISEIKFYKFNRIFYVIADGEDMYLLHACGKQKNKTETRDSELVIKRAKELGERLSKKFV